MASTKPGPIDSLITPSLPLRVHSLLASWPQDFRHERTEPGGTDQSRRAQKMDVEVSGQTYAMRGVGNELGGHAEFIDDAVLRKLLHLPDRTMPAREIRKPDGRAGEQMLVRRYHICIEMAPEDIRIGQQVWALRWQQEDRRDDVPMRDDMTEEARRMPKLAAQIAKRTEFPTLVRPPQYVVAEVLDPAVRIGECIRIKLAPSPANFHVFPFGKGCRSP